MCIYIYINISLFKFLKSKILIIPSGSRPKTLIWILHIRLERVIHRGLFRPKTVVNLLSPLEVGESLTQILDDSKNIVYHGQSQSMDVYKVYISNNLLSNYDKLYILGVKHNNLIH